MNYQIKETLEEAALEKREELTNAIVNIGSKDDKKYGGAGTGVLVKTEYYNKWLVEQQKRNPFIGKSYMQLADEYARDDEDVQKATAMSDETAASALEIDEDGSLHISDDFDPNNVEAVENEAGHFRIIRQEAAAGRSSALNGLPWTLPEIDCISATM